MRSTVEVGLVGNPFTDNRFDADTGPMRHIPMGWRLVAAVFAVCLLAGIVEPGTASAQELRPSLKVPTVIASVAAAAD